MIEEIKRRLDETAATFDDLIDTAVKAYKDGVLEFFEVGNDGTSRYILATHNEKDLLFHDGDSSYNHAAKYISSLYTETFVIESEGDYNSLKGDANIKLLNGEVIKRIANYSPCTPGFSDADGRVVRLSYLTLKGATVTQKR